MGLEAFKPHRVFVYSAKSYYDQKAEHIGSGTWATEDRYIYEVEPDPDLEPDITLYSDNPSFRSCSGARVIRCIHEPGTWPNPPAPPSAEEPRTGSRGS